MQPVKVSIIVYGATAPHPVRVILQDYSIVFSRESPKKPSFVTITGSGGVRPRLVDPQKIC